MIGYVVAAPMLCKKSALAVEFLCAQDDRADCQKGCRLYQGDTDQEAFFWLSSQVNIS